MNSMRLIGSWFDGPGSVVVGLVFCQLAAAAVFGGGVRIESFRQRLDHFDKKNSESFNQRYIAHVIPTTPNQYLHITGEGPGRLFLRRPPVNASLFVLEHRFYGESYPKGSLRRYGRFLAASQAIEDIRSFIELMNVRFNFSSPRWIVEGCSYAGSLAAWVRARHPDTVYGAVAGAAPIGGVLSAPELNAAMIGIMTTIDPIATAAFGQVSRRFFDLLKNQGGRQYLARITGDSKLLDPNVASGKCIGDHLDGIFTIIQSGRLPTWFRAYRASGYSFAFALANARLPTERVNPEAPFDTPMKAWSHQVCSELGALQPTSHPDVSSLLTDAWPLECYIDLCADIENQVYPERRPPYALDDTAAGVHALNTEFGGAAGYKGTRVVFSNSEYDPWRAYSVTEPKPEREIHVVFSQRLTHCRTTPQAARKIYAIVDEWLARPRE